MNEKEQAETSIFPFFYTEAEIFSPSGCSCEKIMHIIIEHKMAFDRHKKGICYKPIGIYDNVISMIHAIWDP